ncbi:MAG: TRAP transporter substrate-binding protein DctP, partial [Alphaproteobacteria bacterium]|nr:TRAP transporter substrate-binding protein DctP [Alphaproteobacteria bacterium]
MRRLIQCLFGVLLGWALSLGFSGAALAESWVLRISTENTASHVQTGAVQNFVDRLTARAGDRLKVEYEHSARLFRDQDVVRAMADGKVDMAVPGMWQLDRFVPEIGLYMLPMFYGLSEAEHHKVRDGAVGRDIDARIQEALDATVIGRWIDLGLTHLYFSEKRVTRHEDLAGLRIRVAGGSINLERLRAFGAHPVVIPWPDFPTALRDRQVDGVLTTAETVKSAALWTSGIRWAFEDGEYFAQYVPIVSRSFWD